MTDAGYVLAAYAVILGGMALYTAALWRRLRATRDRDDEGDDGRPSRRADAAAAAAAVGDPRPRRGRARRRRRTWRSRASAARWSTTSRRRSSWPAVTRRSARRSASAGRSRPAASPATATDLTFVLTDRRRGDHGPLDRRTDAFLPRGQRGGRRGHARAGRRLRGDPGDRQARRELPGARARRAAVGPRLRSRATTSDPDHRACRGPGRPGPERLRRRRLRARRTRRRPAAGARAARRAVIGSFVAAAVGCAAMVASLLAHDFSVLYVAENNATTTPPFISAISLWAALEGSILFWTLLATGWASLVLWRHRDRHRGADALGRRDARIGQPFFFAVMTWPGNPFVRTTPVAAEGIGPNALLQNHPFMALHPPLLYLGYTGHGRAVRVRRGGARDEPARRGVAAHRAALDARAVDVPHARHRRRGVVELRGARLGRLLGAGTRSRTRRSCHG